MVRRGGGRERGWSPHFCPAPPRAAGHAMRLDTYPPPTNSSTQEGTVPPTPSSSRDDDGDNDDGDDDGGMRSTRPLPDRKRAPVERGEALP
jgi:hypothetical protein